MTLFLFVGTLKRCCAGACVCSAALMTHIKGLWPGTMQCLNMADHVFMSRIKTPAPTPPSANSTPPSPHSHVYMCVFTFQLRFSPLHAQKWTSESSLVCT